VTENELRVLIRRVVAEKLRDRSAAATDIQSQPAGTPTDHPSHAVYVSIVNVGDACVIEPDVPCTHCNYCRSHGH
jgi:hypothetical protein